MKHEVKEGVLIFSPKGNLLTAEKDTLVVDTIIKHSEAGAPKVVFNLEKVNFMNSSGLALLLAALTKARQLNGELALCSVPEQTKKLLNITRLTTIFMVFAQEENAILYLKGL